MLTVDLKGLHKEAGAAAKYLASKMQAPVKNRGTTIQMEDVTDREVKLLLHKFLHHRGLDGYRVVVVHPGLVEILPPEHRIPHQGFQPRGSPPTAPATMPYYFPGQGSFSTPAKRSKRKRDRQ